jgi:hypothetical protein
LNEIIAMHEARGIMIAVSELARPLKMALPSFVQPRGVLENCGLVRSKKSRA